jgi:hypothetical protein
LTESSLLQQSYEPDGKLVRLPAAQGRIASIRGTACTFVSKGLAFNAAQGSRSGIFQFAKQDPELAFCDPIASHQQLDREIVKQLVERRLDATLMIEHDLLPPPFDPGTQLASLRHMWLLSF